MNRFELTQDTYSIAYPALTKPLPIVPRQRLYLSEEDMAIMQAAFSTYLEVADPSSREYKAIEMYGYQFEDFKDRLKKKKKR